MRRKSLVLVILLVAALGFAGLGSWLTRSDAGRDFTLKQAQAFLPAGSRLQWKSVTGTLAGGLRFEQLVYADGTQRFEARHAELSMKLTPLVFREVHVDSLRADHVRLYLAKDESPFEFPRWPESLPVLDVPVSVHLEAMQVRDLQVFQDSKPVYALDALDGGFELKPGSLRVSEVRAKSAQGDIRLNGYYQPNYGYATKLEGRAVLTGTGATVAPVLRFSAVGDAKRFLLDVEGAMPEPVRVRWQLEDRNRKPFWYLSASTERFEPSMLGMVDEHAYRMQLAASGDDKRAQIAGELSRDAETLVINPSTLSMAQDDIHLEKLQVLYGGGIFTATGRIHAGTELSSKGLQLKIERFSLPLPRKEGVAKPPVVLDGLLTWSGTLQKWSLAASGGLQRGKESAQFALNGSGSLDALVLPVLRVKTANGGLAGRLQARWKPSYDIAFDGKLDNFDPAYFFPDYPGAVSADMTLAAKQEKDLPWNGAVNIKRLGGQLRGRALAGTADVRFDGLNIAGTADLTAGASRLTLKGSGNARLDVNASLQPLDLNDLNPAWTGRINGTVVLQGDKTNPDYIVKLNGAGLAIPGYAIGRFDLDGNTVTGRRTQLSAEDVNIDGLSVERVDLLLTGRLKDAGYQASLVSGEYALEGAGRMQWLDGNPRIDADSLRILGGGTGSWHLQSPMVVQMADAGYRFSPICLANKDYSARVCAEDTGTAIAIDGRDFPLFLLEPWLNNAGKEFTYTGLASLKGELPKDFDLAGTGFVDLQVPFLKVGVKPNVDSEITRIEDVRLEAKWLGRKLSGKFSAQLARSGYVEGRIETGFSDNAPLSGSLKAQLHNLDWLELFSLDIAQPTGRLNGEVTLSGTRAVPLISGSYVLSDLSFQIPALGLKLNDGQLTAKSSENLAMLVKGSIKSGDGRMAVTGLWDPADQLPQSINLRLIGKNVALADTPDLQLAANTDLILTYEQGIYALEGGIDLIKGFVNLESIDSGVTISSDVVVLDPAPEKLNRSLTKLSLKLDVSASDQVRVSGYGLDGTASGKVAVISPYDSPTKLTGRLELLGKYKSYGRELQITRGNLIYSNSLVTAPRLDILTEREIEDEDITVGLEITGYASNPKTRVVSNPSMTDSEALSWLLFGGPLNSVSSSQADSINAKAMAFNAGGNLLIGTLGSQFGLDRASLSDSRALGDSTLTIGKQLSPKLFVSYGVSLLGIGQVITLKYLLKKGLDITVESEQTDQREETSAALNWRK
jgi:translocation and assembly module TamB